MNIFELAEISGQSLYITWDPRIKGWRASFGCNVVTNKPGESLPNSGLGNGIDGTGPTPDAALTIFVKNIRGKYIKVRHSYDKSAYLCVPLSVDTSYGDK